MMAVDKFDLNSLASYLHLAPAQVLKLVERDKIPGRRVGGQWVFSPAEIHHWLEERIGLSDDEALAHMEDVLQQGAAPGADQAISIAEMLPVEAIAVPLAARTSSRVISSTVQLAAATGWLWDPEKLAEAVRDREQMHPTALECGVALLHPRRPMPTILGRAILALGITSAGIPFGGSGGQLTDIFFLICSIDDQTHLRTLARLSRVIGDGTLLDEMRRAEDARTVHELIAAADQQIDSKD